MPPRKKKPSFDVTGPPAAPPASTPAGWVYRSSPAEAPAKAEERPAKAAQGPAKAGRHEIAAAQGPAKTGRHESAAAGPAQAGRHEEARDAEAFDVVKRYALFAAGAGLLPVPVLDMAAIAAIELKMVADVAEVYKVPFEKDLVRPIVGSLIGGYTATRLGYGAGGAMLKTVPLIGPLLGAFAVPGFGAGMTWAIGRVFIQHFASGGTFLNFDPAQVRRFFARAH